VDGELLQPPRPLPWYPDNLGWHMSFSRAQLRKLPWLSDIHEWMKKANDAGSITRQEAVSMVPPLLLDVEPHHRVGGWGVGRWSGWWVGGWVRGWGGGAVDGCVGGWVGGWGGGLKGM
jgi:hypothetical protein